MNKNIIAIGRSKYLYDAIKHLHNKKFSFKAIFTDTAYEEYEIKPHDFEILAKEIGADFFLGNDIRSSDLINLIKENNIKLAISANWKYTIPKQQLDLFEYGIYNYHLGNLPDYKGNATVNWTIINK